MLELLVTDTLWVARLRVKDKETPNTGRRWLRNLVGIPAVSERKVKRQKLVKDCKGQKANILLSSNTSSR